MRYISPPFCDPATLVDICTYTKVQIYHNKYAQLCICANICQQIYVNQNVSSQGWQVEQLVGGVALGQEGFCSSCIQKILPSSLLSLENRNFPFPRFPVIARSTLSKGRRGLERFIGEAQNAFCPLIGQWVGFLFGAS